MKIRLQFFVLFLTFFMAQPASATEAEQRKIVDRFWTLLEKTPRRGTAFQRVYGFYVDTGQAGELVERCQKSVEERPDDAKARMLLGLVLARRNDDIGAVEAFEKAAELDPADSTAPLYLGEILIAQGRLKEAAESLETALQRAVKDAGTAAARTVSSKELLDILQTLGRVYERFGDRENSARVWNRLEELFPGDRDILLQIAETLEEEGKFDDALRRYRRLIEMTGNDRAEQVRYTLAAADIRIRLGEKQGAIDDFEGLLQQLAPDSWQARSIRERIERIFVRQADYAGLAGYYQKRLQKHPDDMETIRRLAVALVRLSRNDDAKKILAEAIEKAPSDIPLRLTLIDLLVAEQDFEAVDRQYTEIDRIEPNHPDHLAQWGLAILENRKLEENARKSAAASVWRRLSEAKPNDPATVIRVAELMNSGGIFDEAEKYYRKAVDLRPDEPGYREYLGYFYHRRDRKADAVAALAPIASGERRTAVNLSQLGSIFRGIGYLAEAVEAFREAVTLDPNDFELRMKFASLLAHNDRHDEAEKEYTAAEKLVEPTGFDSGRLIKAMTRFYQTIGKLAEVTDSLEKRENPGAADFWRLALYQSAMGRQQGAVDSIEKAVAGAPESTFILDSAAEIFVRSGELRRAGAIYEKLAASDPPGRIEHLKRLAEVQRELGDMDKAVETARLVMATGSGSAANTRFYADMLLNVGRLRDGIEALRRAVRIDPGDVTSLSVLAWILYDSGEADESLEMFWRLFERTEDLPGRLTAVNRMANYWQQMGRFEQFVEQLRRLGVDAVSRRDSAYCTAQAYVTIFDFAAARQVLETLLLGSTDNETKSDDTHLLSQLSSISEQQGDFDAAIRYQEMLCDKQPSVAESERLLSLYRMSGDRSKSIDRLLQTLLGAGGMADRLRAVDGLIAQEDYENAEKFLARIESQHPGDWEISYRRLMLRYWMGDWDAAERAAAELLSLDVSRDEKSAAKKEEESKAAPSTPTRSARYSPRSPYPGYSPWTFGEQRYHSHYYGASTMNRWQAASDRLLQTIFRKKLRLEQHYGQQRSVAADPPKPVFVPESFDDARFAASVWLVRIAMRRDVPEKAEGPKPNGIQLNRTAEALAAVRLRLPTDANDTTMLRDRLRWEYFLMNFLQTARGYPTVFNETDYNVMILESSNDEAAAQKLRTDLEYRLAVAGDRDFLLPAYRTVLGGLVSESEFSGLAADDLASEFDRAAANAPPEFHERFSKEELETAKKQLLDRVEQLHNEKKDDPKAADDRIAFLLRCWTSSVGTSEFTQILDTWQNIVQILTKFNRTDDLAKLREIVTKSSGQNPEIPILLEAHALSHGALGQMSGDHLRFFSFSQRLLWQGMAGRTRTETQNIQKTLQILAELQNTARLDMTAGDFDRNFETFSDTFRRILKLRSEFSEQNVPTTAPQSYLLRQYLSPDLMDHYFSNYLQQIYTPFQSLLQDGGRPVTGIVPTPPPSFVPLGGAAPEKGKKKQVTKTQLDYLHLAERDAFRLLDLYFEIKGSEEKTPARQQAAVPGRTSPNLETLRNYWNTDRISRYMIEEFLRHTLTSNPAGMQRFHLPYSVESFAKRIDAWLTAVEPTEGVDADRARPGFLDRFEKYLNFRQSEGSDADRELIAGYRKASVEMARMQSAAMGADNLLSKKEIDEYVLRANMAVELAESQGEKPLPNHLLLLALLYKKRGETEAALAALDRVVLTRASEYRLRERMVLQWLTSKKDDPVLKVRGETAVKRVMGYQLGTEEMRELRRLLNIIGYNEEATKLRDRLLVVDADLHGQYELLSALERDKSPESREKRVQYALKVFRSPAIQNAAGLRRNEFARRVRDQVLNILKKEGKLGEIVEQVESQWKSSPDSIETMTALADVYSKAGRADDARRIARLIGEKLPDDAGKMETHANLLQNIKLDDESIEWLKKALEKNPEQFLQNFDEYRQIFEKAKRIPTLIDVLTAIRPEPLAGAFPQMVHSLDRWLVNADYGDRAAALLDRIWQMGGAAEATRWQKRTEIVSSLLHVKPKPVYYPIFHDVVRGQILPGPAEPEIRQDNVYPMAQPNYGNASERSTGLIPIFFDLAKETGRFDDVDAEVRKAVADHEAMPEDQRNADRCEVARLTLLFLEARQKRVEAALRLFESLDFQRLSQGLRNAQLLAVQEIASLDDPRAVAAAIACYEKMWQSSDEMKQWESGVVLPLLRLYFRSDEDTRHKARQMALRRLHDAFEMLQKCTEKGGHFQDGNRYYSDYQLYPEVIRLTRLLLDNGGGFELNLLYNGMFNGQTWTLTARRRHGSAFDQLDNLVKEIERKSREEDFAEHLERLIPSTGMDETQNLVASLPLRLGRYIVPFEPPRYNPYRKVLFASDMLNLYGDWPRPDDDPNDLTPPRMSLAGIRFGDALIGVSRTQPDRFVSVKKSLETLAEQSPDEPTLLVALALCRVLAREHEAAETALRRCIDWAEKNRSELERLDAALAAKFSTEVSDSVSETMSDEADLSETEDFDNIYFGLWTLLKTALADAGQMNRPESQILCKNLFTAVSGYMERLYAADRPEPNYNYNRNLFRYSKLNTMLLEFKSHVPESWFTEFVAGCDFHIMEKILFTPKGRMMDRIRYFRSDYADHFSETLAIGATRPVMKAFERLFRDQWPRNVSGQIVQRETSHRLLFIYNRSMEVAAKVKADPNTVFDSLLTIVLPEEEGRPPFLGVYQYLGGENGFFRSPAIDLAVYAVAAGRVDDLKTRIDLKRSQDSKPLTDEDRNVRLDAVEFALALESGDRRRSAELETVFREGTMNNNGLRALYGMIVAVSFIKPYENSEIVENRYRELSELLHACIYKMLRVNRYKRVGYYSVRHFYDRLEKDGELLRRLEWMERYRSVAEPNRMDGFWFTRDERLYREGLDAVEQDRLEDGVAVLRYFASYDKKRFRYRDLNELLDRLEEKLKAKSSGERKALLEKTDLKKIARQSTAARAKGEPMDILKEGDGSGLPNLPRGPFVYVNDFEKDAGPFWSVDRRDTLPNTEQTYLGDFGRETVRFHIPKLPEHRFLRIRFDLLMLTGVDGLVGQAANYGVDVWGMRLDNGRKPIVTSFSNAPPGTSHPVQSFPDDYPSEFGFRPAWYSKVEMSRFEGDPEKGFVKAQVGAAVVNRYGFDQDSTYSVDIVVPHDSKELTIEFFTKFQDDPYDGTQLNVCFGESWGLDNFQIMLLDKPLELNEEQLETCFEALIGGDPVRAAAARWRLVAAENAAVGFISKWFEKPENENRCREIRSEGNFDAFRIDRVLQLIGTPDAESLRKIIGGR